MLTTAIKQDYAGRTTSLNAQPHPTAFAVFLRPKFHYGRDDRPKYKTFGEYASRLRAVVESRLPVTTGKALQLNSKEVVMTALIFQNTKFNIIDRDGQPWLRVHQIGEALDYKNPDRSLTNLYNANADEFTDSMTALIELDTEGGKQQVRVFSLRGCHLLAMLSRTKIAKDFRKWVLDVLDAQAKPTEEPRPILPAGQFTQEVEAAIERRAHTLSLRQYEYIKKQLREAIKKFAGDLTGKKLVEFIDYIDLPDSKLVIVNRDTVWQLTSCLAYLDIAQKKALSSINALENETGMPWYGRD